MDWSILSSSAALARMRDEERLDLVGTRTGAEAVDAADNDGNRDRACEWWHLLVVVPRKCHAYRAACHWTEWIKHILTDRDADKYI